MISELTVHPKPTNKKAKVAFGTLLGLAAADFAVYMLMRYFEIQKAGPVGLLALVFITAAILIYTKYVSPEYYYDITHDSNGYAVFVVRQIIGKRQSTLCRIGLSEIVKAEPETPAERRAHKTPYTHKKYVYVPTLRPDVTYRIYTNSRYEKSEILIEASAEFVEHLLACAREAKEIELAAEEADEY